MREARVGAAEWSCGSHADIENETDVDDEASFDDIMGGTDVETRGELEGFAYADVLWRAKLLTETDLGAAVMPPNCKHAGLLSSFPLLFVRRNKIVAFHNSRNLVRSALIHEVGIIGMLCFNLHILQGACCSSSGCSFSCSESFRNGNRGWALHIK